MYEPRCHFQEDRRYRKEHHFDKVGLAYHMKNGLTNAYGVIFSGTLSPLSSFETELGVTFHQKFEAKHVVGDDQVGLGSRVRINYFSAYRIHR